MKKLVVAIIAILYSFLFTNIIFAACTFTISPSSYSYSSLSNTGSVTVTPSSSDCAWTATSNDSWIKIVSDSSGTGSGKITYDVVANSGTARVGTITLDGQTSTLTQAGTAITNSVGSQNSIKVTDMSGSLNASGAAITVNAWDVSGNAIAESVSSPPLTLYSSGTTIIPGTTLAARFSTGNPVSYEFVVDSPKLVITNVKSSTDGTLNIPLGYTSGVTNFTTNSVGPRNSIKVTDMSGTLSAAGAAITVNAWDVNGNAIAESVSANPLKLYNHGTTIIGGPDLIARFPAAAPMAYELIVDSSKWVITNVKSSVDSTINIPSGYTSGTTNFVANSVGPRNTIRFTDMSGSLSADGASITVNAWDVNGNSIAESGSANPIKLYNYGTTTISGPDLIARFPSGAPMAFEFVMGSSKYIITNVKSSADGTINIPYTYTSGMTNFAANYVSDLTTIKVTDMSGSLSADGASITVNAWDVNGNSIAESGSSELLLLYNYGTTTIFGKNLAERFPTGTPALYQFSIASSKVVITNLTSSADGSINIPYVYTSGVGGGI